MAGATGTARRIAWPLLPAVAFVSAALFLLLAAPPGQAAAGGALLVAVGVIAAAMPLDARVRVTAQAAVVATTGVLVVATGWRVVDIFWSLLALVAVALVVDRVARVLTELGAEQVIERGRLERRLEILAALEDLPESHGDAVRAAVRILRDLGFEQAGVSFVRGDLLHPELLHGVPDPGPQPLDRGLAGRAIRTDTTVMTGDYAGEPDRNPGIAGEHGVIVSPVRVDGRPVGVIMCSRAGLGVPSVTEVETAEVLAAHLGSVLTTLERERRQAELLRRTTRLEELRTKLLTVVSDEVRAPVAEVRSTVAGLQGHQHEAAALIGELGRLRTVAAELAAMITGALAVARRRPGTAAEAVRAVALTELLAELEAATGCAVRWAGQPGQLRPGPRVWLVASLWRSGIELLLEGYGGPDGLDIAVVEGPMGVEVQVRTRPEVRYSPVIVELAADVLEAAGAEVVTTAPSSPTTAEVAETMVRLLLSAPPEEQLG